VKGWEKADSEYWRWVCSSLVVHGNFTGSLQQCMRPFRGWARWKISRFSSDSESIEVGFKWLLPPWRIVRVWPAQRNSSLVRRWSERQVTEWTPISKHCQYV
jgi:hypothetical protein